MKHIGVYFLLSLLFSIPFADFSVCASEKPVGVIEEVKGSVQITRGDDQTVRGRQGLDLLPGDQVKTGKGSSVRFSLKEGHQFRLEEDAQASIDELTGAEREDNQPVVRLTLGYLWARIQSRHGKTADFELHTPSAVMGVRGTEFDTVVSLDANSVFAVDEGRVEVESEDRPVMLDAGRMSQVEIGKKPSEPTPVIPKEKRNWQAWRKKRAKRFFRSLPRMAPKLRKKFEAAVVRSETGTGRINQKAEQIRLLVAKVRHTKKKGDRRG
ncbi:FecR domain-containing protein, partial [Thermodesulfobacteriota bacterium]